MGDAMGDGRRPMLCIVDEGPQLLRSTDGPGGRSWVRLGMVLSTGGNETPLTLPL